MKRSKMLAVVSVLVGLMLLSSCSMIPASKLEALFSTGTESVITSGMTAAAGESDKDTVMISREDLQYTFDVADEALKITLKDHPEIRIR